MIREALIGAAYGAGIMLAVYGLVFVILYNLAKGGRSRELVLWLLAVMLLAALVGSYVVGRGS